LGIGTGKKRGSGDRDQEEGYRMHDTSFEMG